MRAGYTPKRYLQDMKFIGAVEKAGINSNVNEDIPAKARVLTEYRHLRHLNVEGGAAVSILKLAIDEPERVNAAYKNELARARKDTELVRDDIESMTLDELIELRGQFRFIPDAELREQLRAMMSYLNKAVSKKQDEGKQKSLF